MTFRREDYEEVRADQLEVGDVVLRGTEESIIHSIAKGDRSIIICIHTNRTSIFREPHEIFYRKKKASELDIAANLTYTEAAKPKEKQKAWQWVKISERPSLSVRNVIASPMKSVCGKTSAAWYSNSMGGMVFDYTGTLVPTDWYWLELKEE